MGCRGTAEAVNLIDNIQRFTLTLELNHQNLSHQNVNVFRINKKPHYGVTFKDKKIPHVNDAKCMDMN